MKKLTIIIITYNNFDSIEKCLDSALKEKLRKIKKEILVIDNNSSDKTQTVLKKFKNKIKLILNKENFGFAKTVNQGIKLAINNKADYFLLLNPDVILEKDCLKELLKKAENTDPSSLISAKVVDPTNNLPWFTGTKIDWLRLKTVHIQKTNHLQQVVEYLPGCTLLIKKSVIQKVGYFDERFFLYYEDADYSLRAKKKNCQLSVAQNAICYHQESQSSTESIKNYYLTKNALIFFYKHYPFKYRFYFWFLFELRFLYHLHWSKKRVIIKAFRDFLKTLK